MQTMNHNEARERLIETGRLIDVEILLLDLRNLLKKPKYKSLRIQNCKVRQSILMDDV